jgi:hypothetical protein
MVFKPHGALVDVAQSVKITRNFYGYRFARATAWVNE